MSPSASWAWSVMPTCALLPCALIHSCSLVYLQSLGYAMNLIFPFSLVRSSIASSLSVLQRANHEALPSHEVFAWRSVSAVPEGTWALAASLPSTDSAPLSCENRKLIPVLNPCWATVTRPAERDFELVDSIFKM